MNQVHFHLLKNVSYVKCHAKNIAPASMPNCSGESLYPKKEPNSECLYRFYTSEKIVMAEITFKFAKRERIEHR